MITFLDLDSVCRFDEPGEHQFTAACVQPVPIGSIRNEVTLAGSPRASGFGPAARNRNGASAIDRQRGSSQVDGPARNSISAARRFRAKSKSRRIESQSVSEPARSADFEKRAE